MIHLPKGAILHKWSDLFARYFIFFKKEGLIFFILLFFTENGNQNWAYRIIGNQALALTKGPSQILQEEPGSVFLIQALVSNLCPNQNLGKRFDPGTPGEFPGQTQTVILVQADSTSRVRICCPKFSNAEVGNKLNCKEKALNVN